MRAAPGLSDAALERLRRAASAPDFSATRYELLEPLAQGGMGTVYLGRDRELDREVALKVLRAEEVDPGVAERMLREARIIARLEHPGIVPVHEVGRLADGRVFYAMRLVRGERLDRHVAGGRALPELLRIFERLCETVAFAHAHGVIHRDLKPANVMVGPFGEVLVMDWGVAKALTPGAPQAADRVEAAGTGADAEPGAASALPAAAAAAGPDPATAHGTVLGTPGYMAPEQARGEVEGVDERTDVYALGAILYFFLNGRPPAPASEAPDGSEASGRAARPPGRFDPAAPRPLKAVCLRALAPFPGDRYAAVEELAGEVSQYLAGLPVDAYREGVVERLRRFLRRYRTPILLILAYLVMRVVLLLVARV